MELILLVEFETTENTFFLGLSAIVWFWPIADDISMKCEWPLPPRHRHANP